MGARRWPGAPGGSDNRRVDGRFGWWEAFPRPGRSGNLGHVHVLLLTKRRAVDLCRVASSLCRTC
ncbi:MULTISPECIES: putative leader peptide [Actinoalloteichus]|uniref:putative leader peptide n=1 Tax=Actinoalloteichus TaxID=65496 RepID=UPI0035577C77